jgi:hypothetical protein
MEDPTQLFYSAGATEASAEHQPPLVLLVLLGGQAAISWLLLAYGGCPGRRGTSVTTVLV